MADGKGRCPLCGNLIDVSFGLKSVVCPTCGQRVLTSAAIAYRDSSVRIEPEKHVAVSQRAPEASAAKPVTTASGAMSSDSGLSEQPGCGVTVGVFFLCWMAAGFCAGLTSMFMARSLGFTGYSTGGLLTTLVSIACAYGYRSSGKMGGPIAGAIAAGLVVGVIAALIGASMVR